MKTVGSFDINRRTYYSMRRIGNGYEGLKRFLILMNNPSSCDKEELPKRNHMHVMKFVGITLIKLLRAQFLLMRPGENVLSTRMLLQSLQYLFRLRK